MIKKYKTKSQMAGAQALWISTVGFIMQRTGHGTIRVLLGNGILLVGALVFSLGVGYYAKSKGYSPLFFGLSQGLLSLGASVLAVLPGYDLLSGLLLFLCICDPIVLAVLPDRTSHRHRPTS